MSKCIVCKNIIVICTRSKDCHFIKFPHGQEHDGYMPPLHNISDPITNDNMDISFCIDCGFVVGHDPELFRKSVDDFLKEN